MDTSGELFSSCGIVEHVQLVRSVPDFSDCSEATATKNRLETNFWCEISGPEAGWMNHWLLSSHHRKPEIYLSHIALENQVSFKVFFQP